MRERSRVPGFLFPDLRCRRPRIVGGEVTKGREPEHQYISNSENRKREEKKRAPPATVPGHGLLRERPRVQGRLRPDLLHKRVRTLAGGYGGARISTSAFRERRGETGKKGRHSQSRLAASYFASRLGFKVLYAPISSTSKSETLGGVINGSEPARQQIGTSGKRERDERERAPLTIDSGHVSMREQAWAPGSSRPDSAHKRARIVGGGGAMREKQSARQHFGT